MRFSVAAVLGLAAFASAQNSTNATSTAASHSSTIASMTTTSLSPQATCLAACSAADICCQARCVNVPCPSGAQANATTECAARCPQGNGTRADTDKYAQCQASCVSSYFFSSVPPTASRSGNAAATAATTTGSGSGTNTASATGASATNAAPEVRFGAAGVGLIGLIIAGLAM